MTHYYRSLVRTALLLALTIIFQSLRLVIPLPFFLSIFIIGSMVNSCLLVAGIINGRNSAFFIAALAPIIAFFQQMLPLPIFIVPVALGNMLYIWLFLNLIDRRKWQCISICAIGKAVFMFSAFSGLMLMKDIPTKLAHPINFKMSRPQLVAAAEGGDKAQELAQRLQRQPL